MNRPYVGMIAVGMLALAAGLSLWDPGTYYLAAALLRCGLVMGAVWLAFPQLAKPVNWWTVLPIVVLVYLFFRLPPAVKIGAVVASPILVAVFWPKIRAVVRLLK